MSLGEDLRPHRELYHLVQEVAAFRGVKISMVPAGVVVEILDPDVEADVREALDAVDLEMLEVEGSSTTFVIERADT